MHDDSIAPLELNAVAVDFSYTLRLDADVAEHFLVAGLAFARGDGDAHAGR